MVPVAVSFHNISIFPHHNENNVYGIKQIDMVHVVYPHQTNIQGKLS